MTTSHSPADDGRKNSSESSCYAYIYYYFYVFTQLHKSLNYSYICKNDIPNNKHKMKNNTYKRNYELLFSTIRRS